MREFSRVVGPDDDSTTKRHPRPSPRKCNYFCMFLGVGAVQLPEHGPVLASTGLKSVKRLFNRGIGEHRPSMEMEPCRICGGDGRVSNAFGGSSTSCPGCNGSGRRVNTEGFRDVTKTKPSHYTQPSKAEIAAKSSVPVTAGGVQLQNEINSSTLPQELKAKLIREIADYEVSHGKCTQTFCKKIRKQLRVT